MFASRNVNSSCKQSGGSWSHCLPTLSANHACFLDVCGFHDAIEGNFKCCCWNDEALALTLELALVFQPPSKDIFPESNALTIRERRSSVTSPGHKCSPLTPSFGMGEMSEIEEEEEEEEEEEAELADACELG